MITVCFQPTAYAQAARDITAKCLMFGPQGAERKLGPAPASTGKEFKGADRGDLRQAGAKKECRAKVNKRQQEERRRRDVLAYEMVSTSESTRQLLSGYLGSTASLIGGANEPNVQGGNQDKGADLTADTHTDHIPHTYTPGDAEGSAEPLFDRSAVTPGSETKQDRICNALPILTPPYRGHRWPE